MSHPLSRPLRVLAAVDIVLEMGVTLTELRYEGGNTYRCACPFHPDDADAFVVDTEKQFFRCSGCGESGNVIDFVMKRDSVEFDAALSTLEERFSS